MAGAVPTYGEESDPAEGLGDFVGRGFRELAEKITRLLDRFWRLILGTGRRTVGAVPSTAYLGLIATSVALVLLVVGATLYVPGGWGAEDFLGWVDTRPGGPVAAMRDLWANAGLMPVAQLYLILDTVLFVPAYFAFLISLAVKLARALAGDAGLEDNDVDPSRWRSVAISPVVALAVLDLGENLFGLSRLDSFPYAIAVLLVAVLLLVLRERRFLSTLAKSVALFNFIVGVALALVMLVVTATTGESCRPVPDASTLDYPGVLGCAFHFGKLRLELVVTVVLSLAALLWLFGVVHSPSSPRQPREDRAQMRAAFWDIIVRSRYVLITLATFAALVLGLDQARDVMYAVAAAPWPLGPEAAWTLNGAIGSFSVYLLSSIALWAMAFACWLWTRSACQLKAPALALREDPEMPDVMARVWARALGFVPYVILVVLCGGVIRDCLQARYAVLDLSKPNALSFNDTYFVIAGSLMAFALLTVVLGLVYVNVRVSHTEKMYYNSVEWRDWARDAQFIGGHALTKQHDKFRLLGVVTPYWLPFVAMAGAFATRIVGLYAGADAAPSIAFPVIVFTLTLWLCFFGWLSVLEIVRAVPWVVLLVALMGVLGLTGLTENQSVWSPIVAGQMGSNSGYLMLAFSASLAAVALVAYAVVMYIARHGVSLSNWLVVLLWSALLAVLSLALLAGDRHASSRLPGQLEQVRASKSTLGRETLADALTSWMLTLCDSGRTLKCGTVPGPLPAEDERFPVYFISTEGGGIRAAAWTAELLEQLHANDPIFDLRTFSISGVSGGAVGAAVYRACAFDKSQDRKTCLKNFASTDLAAPLLSAWLFEDALAKVLPTSWCHTPACGFLSRSAWFESGMERAAPGLRVGLWESRSRSPHLPYLLLNSTWVESGERAIASDLQIDSRQFPGAKDQLAIADHDLPLATAAHNAARFPYVNAIGQLTAPSEKCDLRDDVALHLPESQASSASFGKRINCGHLADGGYFDNSGGQSSFDALNALVICLTSPGKHAKGDIYAPCDGISQEKREWLATHLAPSVLFIRNGSNPEEETAKNCASPAQPGASQVAPGKTHTSCSSLSKGYHPEQAACRKNFSFYVDALGPPFALFNGSGTGAHGQLSEANQRRAVVAARLAIASASPAASAVVRSVAAAGAQGAVTLLDQMPDGIRYPLGWHLSGAASRGLQKQAGSCSFP